MAQFALLLFHCLQLKGRLFRPMWTVNQEQQTGIEMMLLHTCSLKEWRSNGFIWRHSVSAILFLLSLYCVCAWQIEMKSK